MSYLPQALGQEGEANGSGLPAGQPPPPTSMPTAPGAAPVLLHVPGGVPELVVQRMQQEAVQARQPLTGFLVLAGAGVVGVAIALLALRRRREATPNLPPPAGFKTRGRRP